MAKNHAQQGQQGQQTQVTEPQGGQQVSIETQESMQAQMAANAQQGAPAAPAQPETIPAAPTPSLDDLLTNASPEQLRKIRMLVAQKGMTVADVPASMSSKRTDGSMTVVVYLEPSVVEQLELWAEADGCSLIEEAQKRISEALTNYLYGDWNPVIEQPAAAAVTTEAK